jgi:flavorubredoxin
MNGRRAGGSQVQNGSDTIVEEIAAGIFRLSTWIPGITEQGLTFNQFLLTGDEPLLSHTGHRQLFSQVSRAIARVVPVDDLRWISFGHIEADESGAVNMFLDAAPHAAVIHGSLAVDLSLTDLCDRPPVAIDDPEVLDIGGHRMRFIATPHVPHIGKVGSGSTRPHPLCSPATCSLM